MDRNIFGLVALTLVACISQPIHADEFEEALVAELPDLGPIIQQESVDVDEKLRGIQPVETNIIPVIPVTPAEDFVVPVKQKETVNKDQEPQEPAATRVQAKQPSKSSWRKVIPLRDNSVIEETVPASNDFSLGYRGGHGPGYHTSYSSAGLFLIPDWKRPIVPFSDFRLHVFNDARIAYNLGLGTRVLTPGESWAFGANVFYDYRASARKLHTHQISPGIEVLSKYFDIRASGYFPIGGYKHSEDLKFHRFVGNHLETKQSILTSYKSVSAEVGVPIPGSFSRKIDFYAAAGPYYLFQRTVTGVTCKSALGGQVRISAKILPGVYIEADTHFDRIYHWNGSGSISLHFPLGKKPKRKNSNTSTSQQALARRVHEKPIRNEIIPMCKQSKKELLRDADGHLFNILFVNNLNACPGVGTFESPYCSTALAELNSTSNNHMIYIFTGDGTSKKYNTGFIMDEGQRLQGSAYPFNLLGVRVPNLTADFPIVDNVVGSSIITANSNTTIAGLLVRASKPTSIGIKASKVTNVLIVKDRFEKNGIAIELDKPSGILSVMDNEINATSEVAISGNDMSNAVNTSITRNIIQNIEANTFAEEEEEIEYHQ